MDAGTQELIETHMAVGGVVLRVYDRPNGGAVINMTGANGRDLERSDVDELRVQLTRYGYKEVTSWIAAEGASWLNDGVQSVSVEVVPSG